MARIWLSFVCFSSSSLALHLCFLCSCHTELIPSASWTGHTPDVCGSLHPECARRCVCVCVCVCILSAGFLVCLGGTLEWNRMIFLKAISKSTSGKQIVQSSKGKTSHVWFDFREYKQGFPGDWHFINCQIHSSGEKKKHKNVLFSLPTPPPKYTHTQSIVIYGQSSLQPYLHF